MKQTQKDSIHNYVRAPKWSEEIMQNRNLLGPLRKHSNHRNVAKRGNQLKHAKYDNGNLIS